MSEKPALTPRQRQVLGLVAQGLNADEIGQELFLTGETVRGYMKAIRARLEAKHQAHAVAIGYQRGLLPSSREDVAM